MCHAERSEAPAATIDNKQKADPSLGSLESHPSLSFRGAQRRGICFCLETRSRFLAALGMTGESRHHRGRILLQKTLLSSEIPLNFSVEAVNLMGDSYGARARTNVAFLAG